MKKMFWNSYGKNMHLLWNQMSSKIQPIPLGDWLFWEEEQSFQSNSPNHKTRKDIKFSDQKETYNFANKTEKLTRPNFFYIKWYMKKKLA